ncbi:MAG TPA: DUF445 family protein [Mycobacteriales bacterium]|nr:DUF445 family protein [Mycobacteriales bacterium]
MTFLHAGDDPAAEPDRRRQLRRAKGFATGLLGLAALVFLATVLVPDPPAWVGYLRATAEASMVGALADWFAVTALFRHPMGLPIPHTAIIPQKKDQLGDSLGQFVQANFLAREIIIGKLRTLEVARRAGEWLAQPANAKRLGANAGDAAAALSVVLRDEDLHAAVEQIVSRRIRATPAAPVAAKVLELALEGGNHQVVFDTLLRGLSKFMEENRPTLRDRLAQESPWWVPDSVDDVVFDKGIAMLNKFLVELAGDPNHELRQQYDVRVRELARRLHTDPELSARAEAMKEQLLTYPAIREWFASLGSEIKTSLTEAAADPDSELRRRLEAGLVVFGERLREDAALRAKLDGWLERLVGYLVDAYRAELADLVTGTVRSWDTEQTSQKIELQVGRDLQWIRVNGTVVGALAGLVIYTVAQLIIR